MTLARFSRMCEVIEELTPTLTVKSVSAALSSFDDKAKVIGILSREYPINNIGETRAITWISNALGIFEDELKTSIYTWGDIGEAMAEIDLGNEVDSDITINQFWNLLKLDCSRINSNSYTTFAESLQKMSAREKKWFVRYWLRKPRNGINNKVPLKVMSQFYLDDNIEKYYQYNSAMEICEELDSGNIPNCTLTHGHFVNPMLAKARKKKERPAKYITDVKYDGNRYQIHKENKNVIIFNRKGKVVTNQYLDVADLVKNWDVNSCILDTEIYPINIDGSPAEHKLLAKRVHMKDKASAMVKCPVKLAVFDMLSSMGVSLLEEPLENRIDVLKDIVPEEYQAKIFIDTTIQAAYNLAIDWGFEGVMIKDASMAYQPGKRSKGWLKYKPPRIELDVVITSAEYGKGRRSGVFGTFGISVKDGTEYISVGKVGTGFSDDELTLLTSDLRKFIERYEGNTYYFVPRVVLQVTSDLITNDADGNIGLRFPRSMRVRHDKFPADIDTLQSLKEMI
jgi:DNA ligase-1